MRDYAGDPWLSGNAPVCYIHAMQGAGSRLFSYSCLTALLWASAIHAQTATRPQVVARGTFHLFKMEQEIGTERYRIEKDGGRFRLTSSFKFVDRGTPVPLTSSLLYASDFSGVRLHLKGKIARGTPIDDAIDVQGNLITTRQGDTRHVDAKPRDYFLLGSYAPTALQMVLMQYWRSHKSPQPLMTFPLGAVRIEYRGKESVQHGGQTTILDRYLVFGVIWGREALWLDSQHRLVALVGIDAEFDHFESVRDGYENVLPMLVASAGKDEMATLQALGRTLPGTRAPKLALVGGALVDGTGTPRMEDAVIVIEGDRIRAVGPRATITVPADATVINVTGKTILPGLWDMHAHFEQVEWGPLYLAAGVTTVRDCGNEFEFITSVRNAIRDGHGLGPRILTAGIVDGTGPAAIGVLRADSAEQAKAMVDRYHSAGFNQMKIYSSMTESNVAAVAREAHALGMSVTGHIPDSMTLQQGIDAGMDQVNHISYVLDAMLPPGTLPEPSKRLERAQLRAAVDVDSERARQTVSFLKQHDVVMDPTVAIFELDTASPTHPYETFEPGVRRMPPELAVTFDTSGIDASDPITPLRVKIVAKELQIIGALHKAGVTIVAGTDQGVPGFSLYRELELYVQAGLTPMEAIQTATIVPARVMHLDGEVGTIQAGKLADLIVLGRDPLASISNLRSVEKVIALGAMYETGPLWESVGFKR